MKKLLTVLALTSLLTWTVSSCGSKKDESKKEEASEEYEIAEPAKASPDDLVAQGKALVDGADCKTCHHPTNKVIGPSHTDVAKKYDFTQANVTLLSAKIISGGSGVWGEIPMAAHPDISKADAEKMAMYVLSLDGEKLH